MEFGKYLKHLRENKDMSIRQLSMYSNVSHGYLSQVERGERGIPSPDILNKLARPLGVSYDDLMRAAGYLENNNAQSSDIETQWPEVARVLRRAGKKPTLKDRRRIARIIEVAIEDIDED